MGGWGYEELKEALRIMDEPIEEPMESTSTKWDIGTMSIDMPYISVTVPMDTSLQDCIQEQVSKILSKHIKKGKPLFDYATQYRALCYSNFITKGIKPILSKHISVV